MSRGRVELMTVNMQRHRDRQKIWSTGSAPRRAPNCACVALAACLAFLKCDAFAFRTVADDEGAERVAWQTPKLAYRVYNQLHRALLAVLCGTSLYRCSLRSPWSRAWWATIGAYVLLATWSSRASAYRQLADLDEYDQKAPLVWGASAFGLLLSDSDGPISLEAVADALRTGTAAWSGQSCSSLSVEFLGLTGAVASPGDGVNTVAWVSRGWDELGFDGDQAAITDVQVEKTSAEGPWRIVEADIYLNGEHSRWDSVANAAEGAALLTTTVTHELGHALGLLHPCDAPGAPGCTSTHDTALMHPLYSEERRFLGEDDKTWSL